ncbi:MAG: LysR family transcriptional regulator [Zoogloeaceae bacterium]|jgi:LysR family D-serine deaminase transcriptional activator|nr:LysR family transcriptional regulator [Zoogloeaceae bacterium]
MSYRDLSVILPALPVFLAVARNLSFTRAAADLCITQGAVSHQIRHLENHLGFRLFHRLTRKILLTEAGERMFHILRGPLWDLDNEIRNIKQLNQIGTLVIQSQPSIAFAWLVPRLRNFQKLCPDIEIHMHCSNTPLDFKSKLVDVAISYGEDTASDLQRLPLMQDTLIPVCSPAYADEHGLNSGDARNLAHCTLLHDNTPWPNARFYSEWHLWAETAGVMGIDVRSGFSFDYSSLAFIAAAHGQGVAMGRKILVQDALADGSLITPIRREVPGQKYYAVCRREDSRNHSIQMFLQWMEAEIGAQESTTKG